MKPIYIRRIIERRRELRWTQKRLAEQLQLVGLDVSRSWVNNIEHEEKRLDPLQLRYLARALGVDPNWLLNWEDFQKR